jgi:uncharacterized coiled-coil protein SlyX
MNAHSVLEDWEVTPFDGGFDGLADLGSRGFDGAVEAADKWLFLRDGEPVAVLADLDANPRSGDIDAFEDASGQKHEAPNPAAVTLAAMFALDGEVRGRYFTDDTPLSAVHDTLSGGSFTGYVELSENVLSGDYYYVYVDGAVDHVGVVGSGQRLYGEEARTKAENEVGIYAVTAVSLPELELPEPEETESDAATGPGTNAGAEPETKPDTDAGIAPTAGSDDASDAEPAASPTDDTSADTTTAADADADADGESGPVVAQTTSEDEAEAEDEEGVESEDDSETEDEGEGEGRDGDGNGDRDDGDNDTRGVDTDRDRPDRSDDPTDEGGTGQSETEADEPTREPAQDPYPSAGGEAGSTDRSDSTRQSGPGTGETDRQPAEEPNGSEPTETASGIGGLATRSVPSLDPERSREESAAPPGTDRTGSTASRGRTADASRSADASSADPGAPGAAGRSSSGKLEEYEARIEDLEAELAEHESTIEEYEGRIEAYEARTDEYEARIEDLEAELETVRSERDDLESRLEAMDDGPATGTSYAPEEALAETSLFVRERTRGEATLGDAHDGTEDQEAVVSNLRIDYHTTFDSADVTVENDPFETWLRSSPPYEFAEWLVTELLFEIRSTGAQGGLRPLYDALPAIDRIGFGEELPTVPGESDDPETKQFDIVARDKKGNPLVVAHFDQQRDPTHADTIGPFVADSSDICEAHGTLAAAIAVTSSYFEADAMSATEEATSSSLLSRSKHRSYVKLSRSNGYHLCLVEAREGSFNLTEPDL